MFKKQSKTNQKKKKKKEYVHHIHSAKKPKQWFIAFMRDIIYIF